MRMMHSEASLSYITRLYVKIRRFVVSFEASVTVSLCQGKHKITTQVLPSAFCDRTVGLMAIQGSLSIIFQGTVTL